MKVGFVTNFCPHYRVRTFELLADRLNAEFLFFSGGQEWYWPSRYGLRRGDFPHEYLPGFGLAGTRIVPSLPGRLWSNDYDVIIKCINGRFALPATFLSARARQRPFVLWTGVWQRLGTPLHRLFHPMTGHIYRRADAVVVYGDHVRRFLKESEAVDPDRIFVAPHATDGQPYRRRIPSSEQMRLVSPLGLPKGARVVLYAGRLESAKGVDDLLEAFLKAEFEDTVLLYVGEGSRKQALERSVAQADGGARVRFATGVSPAEMPKYYAIADILVLPSRTTPTFKEPWGLVVNEAFYQAVPAVTTDAVGAAAGGLVRHGRTGLVVPEGDVNALRHALGRLLENEGFRQRLGENAKSLIETWTNERMVEGFVQAVEYAQSRRARP